jgi:hypothetical protein
VTGLNVKRLVWTIIFLGITLAAIVMEVVAGVWHPAGTIPWTEYIAKYVPWPIQLIAYVALAVWLPFHFWRHDHLRKVAYERGRNDTLRRVEREGAARWVGPRTLDLVSDEKLADALRRRGWIAARPDTTPLLSRDGN